MINTMDKLVKYNASHFANYLADGRYSILEGGPDRCGELSFFDIFYGVSHRTYLEVYYGLLITCHICGIKLIACSNLNSSKIICDQLQLVSCPLLLTIAFFHLIKVVSQPEKFYHKYRLIELIMHAIR